MADISKVTLPNENTSYDIVSKTGRGLVRAVMDNDLSTATAFKVVTPGNIESLQDGLTIVVKNTKVTSASGCTLQLNDLAAKRIWLSQSNGWCVGHWTLNHTYIFVFDATNDRWELYQGRDTTSAYAHSLYYYNQTYIKTTIPADSLIIGSASGYEKVEAGVIFDLTYPILWSTAAVSGGMVSPLTGTYEQVYDRNLTKIKSGFTSTAKKMIYLVCVAVSETAAFVDSTIITDSLPTTEDGKIYITLGRLGTQSTGSNYFFFQVTHPMWIFKNGKIQPYSVTQTSRIAQSGGTDLSLVTTGEKATWNSKLDGDAITGAITPYVTSNATASRVIVSDASGKLTTSSLSSSDLTTGVNRALSTLDGQPLTVNKVLYANGVGVVAPTAVESNDLYSVVNGVTSLTGGRVVVSTEDGGAVTQSAITASQLYTNVTRVSNLNTSYDFLSLTNTNMSSGTRYYKQFQIPSPGLWYVHLMVIWSATNSTAGGRFLGLSDTSTGETLEWNSPYIFSVVENGNPTNTQWTQHSSGLLQVASTGAKYYYLHAMQNSGGTLSGVQFRVQIIKLSSL